MTIDHSDADLSRLPEPLSAPFPPQRTIDVVYRGGQLVPLEALNLPDGIPIVMQLAVHVHSIATQNGEQSWQLVPQLELETVEAICEDGAIRFVSPVDLPEGTPIQLSMIWQLAMLATPAIDSQSIARRTVPMPNLARSNLPIHRHANSNGATAEGFSSTQQSYGLRSALARIRAPRIAPPHIDWRGVWSTGAWPLARSGLFAAFSRVDLVLLSCVMLVYALVRYIGLASFPIFFFCDEAIQTNLGVDLFRNGLRDNTGLFLPPYFRNVEKWSLSLTVYIQGISGILFGNSVFVNRATSATVTLLAGVAIALTSRLIFRLRLWWVGPLALAALPVWFLHSRTSFETTMMVSFYACFLCAYLLYRYHNPWYVIAALVFGAATFYSYTNGQGVMLVSGILLLLSDIRYHVRTLRNNPRLLGAALITTALVAAQYIRFRVLLPGAFAEHLRVMDSIWLKDVPLTDKLSTFGHNYLVGLSPFFWFAPNNGIDLERHTFKGWGNFPLIFLPLLLIGLWICLRQWRSSAHRAVLIAILAVPFSPSLAYIHNYRVLAMVIPAAILICLGIEQIANWLISRRVSFAAIALVCALWLVGTNFTMLRVALADGPTWYSDYGIYGSQYGASQVFGSVVEDLQASPETDVYMSPDWANNPNAFASFFLPDEQRGRIIFISPEQYLTWKRDFKPSTIFVLPPFQYDQVRASGKLIVDEPIRIVPFPNGKPGFYFVHMHYVDNIDQIFAAERAERSKLITDTTTLDGQTVRVAHSLTDAGSVANLFDNDKRTLMRTFEANPMVFEIEFPESRDIREIGLDFYRIDLGLTVKAWSSESEQPQTFTATYRKLPEDAHIDFTIPNGPIRVRKLRIELLDLNARDVAKIHVTGMQLH